MFRAAPAVRCYAPSRAFAREKEALEYARQASTTFRVRYAVWSVTNGRPRHVATFAPQWERRTS
jgi:hypothetical protein